MANELVALPAGMQVNETSITQLYGTAVQSAQQHYTAILNKNITSQRTIAVIGGALAVVAVGSVAVVLIQAVVATAVLGITAGALGIGGFTAYKKLPRWLASIENRERERILVEQNRHIEALNAERNRHLATLKAEARKNPIEQLQNYLQDKDRQLRSYQKFVVEIGTQVKSTADMLADRKKAKPDRDYSKKDQAVTAMNAAYQFHLGMVGKGKQALEKLTEAIEDAKFDYKFGQAGQAAMQNMQALEGKDLLNEMLAAESFDSVRDTFNSVFSEIETQIGQINSNNKLEFGEGIAFDVSNIQIPIIQEVQYAQQ